MIARYEMDRVAPPGWTEKGVEVIWTIDWTGGEVQHAAAKERHESGDVAGLVFARFPLEWVLEGEGGPPVPEARLEKTGN